MMDGNVTLNKVNETVAYVSGVFEIKTTSNNVKVKYIVYKKINFNKRF